LTEHKTSQQEIADLLALADRDLNDCQVKNLSEDWRLAIAYNAALQCAAAALAACGYRAARQAHHYRVIQSLVHTIGADAKLVAQLNAYAQLVCTCKLTGHRLSFSSVDLGKMVAKW
jgi:hypothetical protein